MSSNRIHYNALCIVKKELVGANRALNHAKSLTDAELSTVQCFSDKLINKIVR